MNPVVETILSHRSIRDFEEKKLTKEQIETIIRCAQASSTSSFLQAYSIIGVTDEEKKARLAEIASNQRHVAKNGHLFVFCADLYRHRIAFEMEGEQAAKNLESTELFMVALIDAALAAQNAALAAESMGLGICYIGSLRNDLEEVSRILDLPDFVLPLFGLTVGYPAKINEQKPRLALEHIYHENGYEKDKNKYIEQLRAYNETVRSYYRKRTGGLRADTWTGQAVKTLMKNERLYVHDYIKKKGFNKI